MSWARVDDGLWEHQKFEALRLEGEYAAGFLWLLAISHCGAKLNPRITVLEAQMLLACDLAAAEKACKVLASTGLFDADSASKHISSYLIHNWKHYRSKDEAKVRAGRQGGKKKAENRGGKPKQNASRRLADPLAPSKQTSSPDTDTDTDTDTGTDTDTDTGGASRSSSKLDGAVRSGVVSNIWMYYRQYHPRATAKIATKAAKLCRARLDEGFSADDIKKAIDGYHRSPFHTGHNEQGAKYLGFELICRDQGKVQRGIEMASDPTLGTVMSKTTRGTLSAAQQWLESRQSRE